VKRIKGKVAAFVSEREIAINVGHKDGVRVGMVFAVLSSTDAEVKDPDTGETLGTLDREVTRVQAVDVQDRMTVCAPYSALHPTALDEAIEAMYDRFAARHLRRGSSRRTLPTLNPPDLYVRIGDRVRQVDEP
jgi:hypothetical protein